VLSHSLPHSIFVRFFISMGTFYIAQLPRCATPANHILSHRSRLHSDLRGLPFNFDVTSRTRIGCSNYPRESFRFRCMYIYVCIGSTAPRLTESLILLLIQPNCLLMAGRPCPYYVNATLLWPSRACACSWFSSIARREKLQAFGSTKINRVCLTLA